MRFIIMPIEDVKVAFTEEELSTMRKSLDGTKVIAHEEILVKRRNAMGLTTLPSEETGVIEWTYPVYNYKSEELDTLLSSDEWSEKEEI